MVLGNDITMFCASRVWQSADGIEHVPCVKAFKPGHKTQLEAHITICPVGWHSS